MFENFMSLHFQLCQQTNNALWPTQSFEFYFLERLLSVVSYSLSFHDPVPVTPIVAATRSSSL
ncbi:hypothetical protein ACTXT7_015479 [Hymenolepis weldensis]